MNRNPLLPTNDFVFHKIFAEHTAVLTHFLESVQILPEGELQELKVVDPDLEREYPDDKLSILDIKAYTKSGKVIDVEMQVAPQSFIWKRMTFYNAKMVVEQIKSGEQYTHLNKVITILIADFRIVENDAHHNCFCFHDKKTHADFPESPEIHVLELPKLRVSDGTDLGDWMFFFNARTEEEMMNAARANPAIQEAWGVIQYLSGDERARALAESREKARMDMDARLYDAQNEGEARGLRKGRQEGRQEGLLEGKQEGLLEGKQAIARNALLENLPVETVVKLTGLSFDEINRLAAEQRAK